MWKLYEIFKVLKVQKRILVSGETIRGNTVFDPFRLELKFYNWISNYVDM